MRKHDATRTNIPLVCRGRLCPIRSPMYTIPQGKVVVMFADDCSAQLLHGTNGALRRPRRRDVDRGLQMFRTL